MRMFWKLLPVILAVPIGAVVAAAPAEAIANGTSVPDGRYPFAVKLIDNGIPTADGGRRDSSCSGGLVSPHWVLTAGHCFKDADGRRVSRPVAEESLATVGRTDQSGDDGHETEVVEVRQHGEADVALARLDRGITDITPLRLSRARPAAGQKARLVGYGLTTATAKRTPDRLRTGQFRVTGVEQTEMGLSGVSPKRSTSPCERDSGGPYFTEAKDGAAVVVGVVSRGPACPHTGPDIATRVDAIAPWILSIIKSDLAASPSVKPSKTTKKPAKPGGTPARTTVAAPPAGDPAALTLPPAALLSVPIVLVVLIGLLTAARGKRRYRGRRRNSAR
ncbi:putative trypsin-like serine protease [Actinoplanes missouriensis 431]|uniref:Putative trypsin-like serine protease n=2 Tax=Actinoplanes missouriensis TaxID=1866 RepID=I0H932_ACTM4|nr:putative trypsin-like serine protease [Actinoplanes missouriensis 431]